MKSFLVLCSLALVAAMVADVDVHFDIGRQRGCVPKPRTLVEKARDKERVGILAATASDLAGIMGAFQNDTTFATGITMCGRKFHVGTIENAPVVVVMTGMGPENSVLTAQCMCSHFKLKSMVLFGNAGGVSSSVNLGDVTFPKYWAIHDRWVWAKSASTSDMLIGEMSGVTSRSDPGKQFSFGAGDRGALWPQKSEMMNTKFYPGFQPPSRLTDSEYRNAVVSRDFWMEVNDDLYAKLAGMSATLDDCVDMAARTGCLSVKPIVRVGGRGVSGSIWVDNAAYTNFLAGLGDGVSAVDTETANAFVVAKTNEVPMVAFRNVGALGGGNANPNEVASFNAISRKNSAIVISALIKAIA